MHTQNINRSNKPERVAGFDGQDKNFPRTHFGHQEKNDRANDSININFNNRFSTPNYYRQKEDNSFEVIPKNNPQNNFDDLDFQVLERNISNSKPKPKTTFYGNIFLVLAVVFFVYSLLLSNLIRDTKKVYDNCNDLSKQYAKLRVSEQIPGCDYNLSFNYYFLNKDKKDFENQINILESLIQEKTIEADNLKQTLEVLKLEVSGLEIESQISESNLLTTDIANYQNLVLENQVKTTVLVKEMNAFFAKSVWKDLKSESQKKQAIYKSLDQSQKNIQFSKYKNLIFDASLEAKSLLKDGSELGYNLYSGQDWLNLVYLAEYKTTTPGIKVEITGNLEADNLIIKLAEGRGYKLRDKSDKKQMVAVSNSEYSLQSEAVQDLQAMIAAAKKEGIDMFLNSGYRSAEDQKDIFIERLTQNYQFLAKQNYSPENLNTTAGRQAINKVLETTAPPGYSKHHTGYTIDLADSKEPVFAKSASFTWVSKNNYLNAKKFGFVPSYPPGVNDGPVPEAWEYVWVGKEWLIVN